MKLYTKILSPELWEDFESYFEYQGQTSGCWCMNHRLPIGCDFEGEAAKLAMQQLIQNRKVFGLLAYCENDLIPVGWCALDRRKTLPGHDCVGEDIACANTVWSIHCVTSRSDFKNKGVEKLLSTDAIHLARQLSATSIESYPEPNSIEGAAFTTWNTFNGYQSCFEQLGFEKIEKDFGSHAEFYCPMHKSIDT